MLASLTWISTVPESLLTATSEAETLLPVDGCVAGASALADGCVAGCVAAPLAGLRPWPWGR